MFDEVGFTHIAAHPPEDPICEGPDESGMPLRVRNLPFIAQIGSGRERSVNRVPPMGYLFVKSVRPDTHSPPQDRELECTQAFHGVVTLASSQERIKILRGTNYLYGICQSAPSILECLLEGDLVQELRPINFELIALVSNGDEDGSRSHNSADQATPKATQENAPLVVSEPSKRLRDHLVESHSGHFGNDESAQYDRDGNAARPPQYPSHMSDHITQRVTLSQRDEVLMAMAYLQVRWQRSSRSASQPRKPTSLHDGSSPRWHRRTLSSRK
ncbi:hypothetical protein [Sinomonas sp. P47F7]|uniref:hypothetical protein n=1 Tax=Sinomonas sp. P47F7 TaxID=3410987 RepID=UPI003BF48D66